VAIIERPRVAVKRGSTVASEQSKIITNIIYYLVDIAVDWISDKIYWTNTNQIMVYDLQRGYQSTVINSESDTLLHQVLVDPNAR
jgi:hypothetical protein